jgi:DNA-binding response OmpR family regulator
MTRPLTDRERANILEVRVAELQEELAAYRKDEAGDDLMMRLVEAMQCIRGITSPAQAHPRGTARLLLYMLERPGRLCLMDDLFRVLECGRDTMPASIKTTVSRARSYLRARGIDGAIRNIWGQGYVLEPTTAAAIRRALSCAHADAPP